MPSPVVHDIFAKSDLSVPIKADTGEREIYFRGTHGSVKVPRQSADPIVTIVADIVRRYGADPLLGLIDHLLGRIAEVNKLTGVENLIGTDADTSSNVQDRQKGPGVHKKKRVIRSSPRFMLEVNGHGRLLLWGRRCGQVHGCAHDCLALGERITWRNRETKARYRC